MTHKNCVVSGCPEECPICRSPIVRDPFKFKCQYERIRRQYRPSIRCGNKIKATFRVINAVNELRVFWKASTLEFRRKDLRNVNLIYETSRHHGPKNICLNTFSDGILKAAGARVAMAWWRLIFVDPECRLCQCRASVLNVTCIPA